MSSKLCDILRIYYLYIFYRALEQAKNSPDRKKSQPKEALSSYNLLPSKVYKKIVSCNDAKLTFTLIPFIRMRMMTISIA